MRVDSELRSLLAAAGLPAVPVLPTAVLGVATSGVPVELGPARYSAWLCVSAGSPSGWPRSARS